MVDIMLCLNYAILDNITFNRKIEVFVNIICLEVCDNMLLSPIKTDGHYMWKTCAEIVFNASKKFVIKTPTFWSNLQINVAVQYGYVWSGRSKLFHDVERISHAFVSRKTIISKVSNVLYILNCEEIKIHRNWTY